MPSARRRAISRSRAQTQAGNGLPLLGRIAAGAPILADGNIEERMQVDPALFRPRANFLLRVRGDSMKDADILDRDLLAVHQTTQARNGQIVVARIGDEATVKYYRRQGQLVRLEPANAAYQPIEIDLRKQELTIEGLAVGVIRTGLTRRSRTTILASSRDESRRNTRAAGAAVPHRSRRRCACRRSKPAALPNSMPCCPAAAGKRARSSS